MSLPSNHVIKDAIHTLQSHFAAENILTDPAECLCYGYDNSCQQGIPSCVVFAKSENDILQTVKIANQYNIPLIARGRGTNTVAATVPQGECIVLSCERMNKIKEFDPDNRYIVVEPGVLNQDVQNHVKEAGFFWAPDPGSAAFSTVGGNLACGSAGPRAVKYGTARENTLGLSAVTGDGKLIKTGVYTTKSVVGYDLTRLFIGSEGTLGIITEATLKLLPISKQKLTLQVTYQDISSATQAITQIMSQSIIPCALEFMDSRCLELIRNNSDLDLPENAKAMLLVEFDDNNLGSNITEIVKTPGLIHCTHAQTAEQSQQLWKARKALSPILRNVAPNKINEDVVVPIKQLPQLIAGLEQLSQEFELTIANFGHAGNGNIHVNILYDASDDKQNTNAKACLDKIFELVLSLKGSLSGEHGVGLMKRDFVADELDANALHYMKQLKSIFDPNGILNPGKSLPI